MELWFLIINRFGDEENLENEEIEIPEKENPEKEKIENPEIEESDQTDVEDGEVTHEDFLESLVLNISDKFDELMLVVDEKKEEQKDYTTLFESDSGFIVVRHEMTLGDLILATLLASILILQIISTTIRRF